MLSIWYTFSVFDGFTISGYSSFGISGNNSSNAFGSRTIPDKLWDPTYYPLSMRQTDRGFPVSISNYFKRIAVESPAGPPPTITTSYSKLSLYPY